MILVRVVFQVRQGAIRQMVDMLKQATSDAPNRPRILTDLSGPFNTLVLEMCYESLAAAEQWRSAFFAGEQHRQEAGPDWVIGGSTEFYTIEQA